MLRSSFRLALLVFAVPLCCLGWAQNYPAPPFLPPAGHPRVYFMAKDLPALRANTTQTQNAAAWAGHLQNLKKGTDGVLGKLSVDSAVLSVIESYAFDYALNANAESGRKAISAMRNYLKTAVIPAKDYNNAGQTVFTIAVVYDWCHSLLSAEDRRVLHDGMLDTAKLLEIGWPPTKQGNVVGHGPEGQLMRDLMSASIAMYDEYPELYRIVAGRFFAGMVENKKFMYQAHMHPQGSHYGNYRGQWEMLATWLFDRMGLPQVFGPDQRWLMYWALYARRPDGSLLRDGDTHINNNVPGTYYSEPGRTMLLAANYFNDPYLKGEALRELPELKPTRPYRNQGISPVEILVFNKPEVAPRPLAELPLTHYYPYPKGAMIARTGWQDGLKSAAVLVEMKINEWFFTNHEHLDAGAFQIYYRGALATDSGYYQAAKDVTESPENSGSSGYASAHDYNYNKRSIAHNTIRVFDPDERLETKRWKTASPVNDGGQRLPNAWIEPQEHAELMDPANGYHIAKILGHGFGPDQKTPDYTYLKGDLTNAYSAKMKAYERSFVFLNLKQAEHPAALLVYDRVVSAKAQFAKSWLLHGLEQPQINGNRVVFKDTRKGYTGKLTFDTVLPEADDTSINAVGGPDKEFFVAGVNWKVLLRPNGNNEGGGWRVEVSPKTARIEDVFLNVLQVGDHTPDVAALPVQRIDCGTHTGLRLADRVVLFGKGRDRVGAAVTFTVTGAGTAKILVSDLKAGRWSVARAGKSDMIVTVAAEDGVAYFDGEAGIYRLRPL